MDALRLETILPANAHPTNFGSLAHAATLIDGAFIVAGGAIIYVWR